MRGPVRKSLPHEIPSWVDPSQEIYFLTITCQKRGGGQLCHTPVGEVLLESVKFRHGKGDWFVHLFLLMPDHLHALLSFPANGKGLHRAVSSWKSWTAKRTGVVWQRDFFEHRLRADESFDEKAAYIRMNPVRLGLVHRPEDWPWKVEALDLAD